MKFICLLINFLNAGNSESAENTKNVRNIKSSKNAVKAGSPKNAESSKNIKSDSFKINREFIEIEGMFPVLKCDGPRVLNLKSICLDPNILNANLSQARIFNDELLNSKFGDKYEYGYLITRCVYKFLKNYVFISENEKFLLLVSYLLGRTKKYQNLDEIYANIIKKKGLIELTFAEIKNKDKKMANLVLFLSENLQKNSQNIKNQHKNTAFNDNIILFLTQLFDQGFFVAFNYIVEPCAEGFKIEFINNSKKERAIGGFGIEELFKLENLKDGENISNKEIIKKETFEEFKIRDINDRITLYRKFDIKAFDNKIIYKDKLDVFINFVKDIIKDSLFISDYLVLNISYAFITFAIETFNVTNSYKLHPGLLKKRDKLCGCGNNAAAIFESNVQDLLSMYDISRNEALYHTDMAFMYGKKFDTPCPSAFDSSNSSEDSYPSEEI